MFSRCSDNELPENEQVDLEVKRAMRSLFVQDLLVSTLETLNLDSNSGEPSSDFDAETENCIAEAVSDTPHDETSLEASEQSLANDMELINLEEDKDL